MLLVFFCCGDEVLSNQSPVLSNQSPMPTAGYVRDETPIGSFPEVLALSAVFSEDGVDCTFSLVAALLFNTDEVFPAALGYSTVIRSAGLWWWHPWTATGPSASEVPAREVRWEHLQALGSIVLQLYYVRECGPLNT